MQTTDLARAGRSELQCDLGVEAVAERDEGNAGRADVVLRLAVRDAGKERGVCGRLDVCGAVSSA